MPTKFNRLIVPQPHFRCCSDEIVARPVGFTPLWVPANWSPLCVWGLNSGASCPVSGSIALSFLKLVAAVAGGSQITTIITRPASAAKCVPSLTVFQSTAKKSCNIRSDGLSPQWLLPPQCLWEIVTAATVILLGLEFADATVAKTRRRLYATSGDRLLVQELLPFFWS